MGRNIEMKVSFTLSAKKLLNEIKDICGIEKNISISREISKIFEETIRGTVSECLSHFENNEPKGEFVICIEGLKS